MTKFDAKNQSTNEIVRFESLPVDVSTVLDPGTWILEEVVAPEYTVNVLEVAFATAPALSGTATAGATLTVSGTATAALAYEYRWLVDGVVIPGAISATYTTDATLDLGKTFTGQMRAQDARGRWTAYVSSSNSITIPAPLVFTVADNKWTGVEATSDANTRKTTVEADCIGNTPPTGLLYWYKGTNSLGNLAQVSAMIDDGDGTFSKTSTGTEANGVTAYVRLAYWNAAKVGGAGYDWCSSVKTYTTSSVPAAPTSYSLTPSATVTGDVALNITALPTTNGRPITAFKYTVNNGALIDLVGTGTGSRTINIAGVDLVTVRLYALNVNGTSAAAALTVTPPVITGGTNTVAPEIDSSFYGRAGFSVDTGTWTGSVVSFVVDIEKSDNGTTGWTTHAADVGIKGEWPQTTLDSKYVRAKVTPPVGSPAYSAVYQMKNSPTHVLLFTNDVVNYPVTAPLFGADLTTGGIWFSFMFYYTSGIVPSDGYAFSFGSTANTINHFSLHGSNGFGTLSGTQLQLGTLDLGGAPVDPQGQWYIITLHWYAVGSVHYVRGWRNDVTSVTAGVSRAFTLSGATSWTSLRIGGAAASSTTAAGRLWMCGWLGGTGNPEQFHLDTFNEGDFRNPFDYNFATDPNGATKNFGVEGYRVGAATFANSQIADVVGAAGTPTTVSGAPIWWDIPPPFVRPTGPATPVQGANIKPAYAPAGTQQSFQYGYGKTLKTSLTASPWITATSYALDARVTQGGSTYICVSAHTSGTFATDLTAGNWAIYTINSLTHVGYPVGDLRFPAGSVDLNNILPSVVNGIFTCNTPGTITANVTCGKIITTPSLWTASTSYTAGQKVRTGTPEVFYECTVSHTSASAFSTDLPAGLWQFVYGTVDIVCNLYEPQTMPASPRNAADYDGNGLLCAFDPYPTPAAAGTTYATVAALASAIGAVGAGGYLCVNNLTDTGTDLTIPPGDYAGAVIEAKNLHGVNVKDVFFHGVRNLTLRGFKGSLFQGGNNDASGNAKAGVDGFWLDHCYGTQFNLGPYVKGASRVRVKNWQTPEDGTAGYHRMADFLEAILLKAAIGISGPTNYTDRLHPDRLDRFIADRVYVGPGGGLLAGAGKQHLDLVQPIYSGKGGFFGGYIINSAFIDEENPLTLPSSGALFADGNTRCKDLWVNNVIGRDRTAQSIAFEQAFSNCAIENSYGQALVIFKSTTKANAGYAENNVKGASSTIMASTAGTEINTVSIADRNISVTTIYPQYSTHALSWRALANPSVGYTDAGPAVFIAELEAKRVALGI